MRNNNHHQQAPPPVVYYHQNYQHNQNPQQVFFQPQRPQQQYPVQMQGNPQQQGYVIPPQQQPPYNPQQTFSVSPNMDPEDPESRNFQFDDQSIRKAFIRKVFSILSVQLLVTFGVVSLFIWHEPTVQFIARNVWILWASIIATFVILIVLACCEGVRRKFPINMLLLGLFTCCMSLMLGVISASYKIEEVYLALGITIVITVALTIFAFQTKWDFTTMGGILFVGVIVLIILAIFAIIFPSRTLTIVYASLGALIFCFYLVYDIQLMMGGKHKYSLSPEEYIFAALNLYIDIVNIFMYILMLIGAVRS